MFTTHGLLHPSQEPLLMTSHRARPSLFKPREVAEAEAMAQIPAFRASTLKWVTMGTGWIEAR